jgi:hypothetical protein
MKHVFATMATLTLMGSELVPALKADEWDKKTIIAIDRSWVSRAEIERQ